MTNLGLYVVLRVVWTVVDPVTAPFDAEDPHAAFRATFVSRRRPSVSSLDVGTSEATCDAAVRRLKDPELTRNAWLRAVVDQTGA